jgi:hypothetical protein
LPASTSQSPESNPVGMTKWAKLRPPNDDRGGLEQGIAVASEQLGLVGAEY